MGRYKNEMKDLIESQQDTIQQLLFKLFAYHKDQPTDDINRWLTSLNEHLYKFKVYNIPRGKPKGLNCNREELIEIFVFTLFEDRDIEQLNYEWSGEGFPIKYISPQNCEKLRKLAEKYVDSILTKAGAFLVSWDELL